MDCLPLLFGFLVMAVLNVLFTLDRMRRAKRDIEGIRRLQAFREKLGTLGRDPLTEEEVDYVYTVVEPRARAWLKSKKR